MLTRQHQLSIIVPIGPGDAIARRLASQLRTLADVAEVMVVQAGSPTESIPAAGRFRPGWTTIRAASGRASQQNAGARCARGRHLWFLHADSRLGDTTLAEAARQIARGETRLAYFDLRFANDGPRLMWLNEWGARLRCELLGLPFGDQGFLLPRALFEQLGGFDERLHAGEDHDLVWRARRSGIRLRRLPAPMVTSARKYARGGWLQTTLSHLRITACQARRFSQPLSRVPTA